MSISPMPLRDVTLNDKYIVEDEPVFLTGNQALVRLTIMQRHADIKSGLNTAGYVTGYRGSPVGNVDQAFLRAGNFATDMNIRLHPAVNEDLAATAVWGTQQAGVFEASNVNGVFSMWYGKGPGVHRTGDVFLHANLAGTSPNGGVLAIAGDDHLCKSSTNTHQSEFSFMDAMIPTLNPAGLQDMLDLGLYGWAMSRYSGCWSGMKVTSETLDSSASVWADIARSPIAIPEDFNVPQEGLGIRWPDKAVDQERRLHEIKLPAVLAFARANRLDRVIYSGPSRRIGIVTTGKSYLDTLQAFERLGLSETNLKKLGISVYKVGMSWPLEPQGIKAFCTGLKQVLVVEEKRSLIESQLKDILYNIPASHRPQIYGKHSKEGVLMLPAYGELTSADIIRFLSTHIPELFEIAKPLDLIEKETVSGSPAAIRTPYFCSGCPHSSSTKVPEGSKAFAGIGCHYMTIWMDRKTEGFTHMGGEGANWIGLSEYTETDHMFQNMGDGTYFHSGYLALRAAVAAKVNMTYKILFNDAVAMTGGQPMDGDLTPLSIARQAYAEGVKRIAIVAEDINKYTNRSVFPEGVTFHQRRDMDAVQKELREIKGISVIIFDQMCAAEKRRKRRRGTLPEPETRMMINELVCEGCGDCSKTSNCLSVVPVETEFGTKRKIEQSSCNKDYTCSDGFCPSFVSVTGGSLRKGSFDTPNLDEVDFSHLPEPHIGNSNANILVAGIGGTGVVTIGALIAMAAHLESKGCSTLDIIGMAQKGGQVTSHIKIAKTIGDMNSVRIAPETADLVIGCDMVVAASTEAISLVQHGKTQLILNDAETTTSQFVLNRSYQLPTNRLKASLTKKIGAKNISEVDASKLAQNLLGDTIGTNLFMVGIAFQKGLLPISAKALLKAIELNGVAIKMNKHAFSLGRLYVHDPKASVFSFLGRTRDQSKKAQSVDEIIGQRKDYLTEYQNTAYAERYESLVIGIKEKEMALKGKAGKLTEAFARNAFKLMAYKDEYEVARLMTSSSFKANLNETFEGDFKLSYNLAPPLFAPKDKSSGLPRKVKFGAWVGLVFASLSKFKGLRGTAFDIFGYTEERRIERKLRDDYLKLLTEWSRKLTLDNYNAIVDLANIPDQIRGFGHVKLASIDVATTRQKKILEELAKPKKVSKEHAKVA